MSVEKQRRVAWAKYYELENTYLDEMTELVGQINRMNVSLKNENYDKSFPYHIQEELVEMYKKLKTKIECPICFEELNRETLHITNCGHKLCKSCLENIDDKCPICRKKIYKKK